MSSRSRVATPATLSACAGGSENAKPGNDGITTS